MRLNVGTVSPRRQSLDRGAVQCLARMDSHVLDARAKERGRDSKAGYCRECGRKEGGEDDSGSNARKSEAGPGFCFVALEVRGVGLRG